MFEEFQCPRGNIIFKKKKIERESEQMREIKVACEFKILLAKLV
jgi:hypothetical protein